MGEVVVGLCAHVDAGKTTLAEALLWQAGQLRRMGRVDHGDSYLDFEPIERRRGITVFSKQARLTWGDFMATLLDTPGHVDFAGEAERALSVLDMAVLVIAANDGVGGQTRTLSRLLARYGVPTIVFVNKCDLAGVEPDAIMERLRADLDEGCQSLASLRTYAGQEACALADEESLEEFLETGALSADTLRRLVGSRRLIPCLFGSALRMEGIDVLLDALRDLAPIRSFGEAFAGRVFKVTHEGRGARLVWVKVTGGVLRAKDVVRGVGAAGIAWEDKVDQLRVYDGARYEVVGEVGAAGICCCGGLGQALPGDALGQEEALRPPLITPVLSYRVWSEETDARTVYQALSELAEEDPLLHLSWDEEHKEVGVRLMGVVQQEVVEEELRSRHGISVSFGAGSVLYQETIEGSAVGIGHFEPLRHYAEVHLLLEPGERGSGVTFASRCPEDELAKNWQRLIRTHVFERVHRGKLMGAPLTDVRVTLLAGRAHLKHTEGGDFRQATYRALRCALMQAEGVVLEPLYRFSLLVPVERVGRALSDLSRLCARFSPPAPVGSSMLIEGVAPVSTLRDYPLEVSAYTKGEGSCTLEFFGYEPAHDAERLIEEAAYDPERDLAHTPDSVFCSHGAGYTVKWRDVAAHAHVQR